MWVLQSKDSRLPTWLTDNLKAKCECGYEMENFYNSSGDITARRCSNPDCPYRMAQKVVGMCEILGIKGIGEKTAYKIISEHNLTSHLEALPYISSQKYNVTLGTYLKLLFVKGISNGWDNIAGDYKSLDDFLEHYDGKYVQEITERKAEILKGAKFINVQNDTFENDPLITGTVMISGNIKGLKERNNFIYGINKFSNGLVQLRVSESKRKTGIMALIQEADTPNRGKAECAIENNIPIMTPDEFKSMIIKELASKLKEKGGSI